MSYFCTARRNLTPAPPWGNVPVMSRHIVRTATRRGLAVATIHPDHGQLHRGWIDPVPAHDLRARGMWRLTDADHHDRGVTVGDYADAENHLLALTNWADQPTRPEETPCAT
jgi:hypothetical protein